MYKNESEYCDRIVAVVSNLFDREWEQIVIRICKDELHSSIGVYCRFDGRYTLIGDLIPTGKLDINQYREINFALSDIAEEMQNELSVQNQDIWRSMVFILRKGDIYEVRYSYDDLADNSFEESVVWRYKYLGIVPNESNIKYIDGIEQDLIK